jgi:excisionase family DNA binding protein
MENLQTVPLMKAAAILCVTVRTLYRIRDSGALPFVKVGGSNRVRVSELEAYLVKNSSGSGVAA